MKRSFMFICAAALLLTGCGASADEASAQLFAMDTVMQLDAYGHQVKQAVSDAEETIQALEARLSRTREDSLVSVLNQNGAAQDLSAAEQALLSEALTFRDATGGAFDITIAPVMDAWGFTGASYRVPAQDELDALLENVNSDEIRLSGSSVTLGAGQAIDLGGIAKGYTSDCVEAVFRENKIESGKISLGGNVFVLGGKPDGADWRVGIRDPQDENALAAVLTLRDAYAITSGGYERYFTENGNTYHHIIDPSTAIRQTAACCRSRWWRRPTARTSPVPETGPCAMPFPPPCLSWARSGRWNSGRPAAMTLTWFWSRRMAGSS